MIVRAGTRQSQTHDPVIIYIEKCNSIPVMVINAQFV